MNRLFYGDCLTVMRDELSANSVDLIYLDPPFNSNRAYNAIYKDETGRSLPDRIEAFCDLWRLDEAREREIKHLPVLLREYGIDDDIVGFWQLWMNALRRTDPKMLAYLAYMAPRLVVMRTLLRPTGSIYLHCDPTASHYIKVMMDGIFGRQNFRNEIVWFYPNRQPAKANKFQGMHDVLLVYSAGENPRFNTMEVDAPRARKDIDKGWATDTLGGKRRLRVYNQEKVDAAVSERRLNVQSFDIIVDQTHKTGTKPCPDVWTINFLNPNSRERMGYDTQKPMELLKRVIAASTEEGDVVLDPFCGCATTLEAAHRLKRQWIGIDIAYHAIRRVAAIRLGERCTLNEGRHFTISGVPGTLEGAQDLWQRDPYHFQKWIVEEVDGFVTAKRTADGGIDGRLYFDCPGKPDLQSMVIEVKGGANITLAELRALRGVLEREEALMAGLIVMQPLSERKMRNFQQEMAHAGNLDLEGAARQYPRMQLLSVAQILDGKRFATPAVMGRTQSSQLRFHDRT